MQEKPSYETLEKRVQELEAALDQRERILDHLPLHVLIQDTDHTVLWANQAACRSLDCDRQAVLGGKCHELWNRSEAACPDCPMSRSLESGTWESGEKQTPDGRYWRVRCLPLPDGQGERVSVLQMTEDITETVRNQEAQRRTEIALRKSEERYRLLVEQANEAILVAQNGVFVFANPKAEALFGYCKEALSACALTEFIHEADRQMVGERHERRLWGETLPDVYSFRIIHSSKAIRWVELKVAVFSWNHKPATLCFFTDITQRRQAEAALQENEKVMRYIIKHDPNAIAVYDRNLRYIAVSDRYLRDYNLAESDIRGKHHYAVFPEMPQRWKAVHQRVLQGATERNDDDSFLRPDGSITYNRWECRPWYRGDGSIGGMITYTEVTTERKLAEKALKESRNRYQTLFESANDAIFVACIQTGTLLDANRKAEQLIGRARDQIIGMHQSELHPPSQKRYAKAAFQEVAQNPQDAIYDHFLVQHADGRQIPVEISNSCIEMEKRPCFLGIFRDVSEQKKAREALLKSERKYRLLADNVEDIIWTLNADLTHYTYVSPSIQRLLGYSAKEVMEKGFDDCTLPESFIKIQKELMEGQEEGSGADRILRLEGACTTKEGRRIYVESVTRPLRDADGGFDGIVGVTRDITARKQAEETIRQLQKAESLARMAGAIAHHFNNMLAAVIGNLELANDALSPETAPFDNILQAQKAAYRASDMSQLMLTYLGHRPTRSKPLDLSAECREYLKALRETLSEQVALEIRFPAAGPVVRADAAQMEQVLKALATNAWEAMAEDRPSRIRVSIGTVASSAISDTHRYPVGWEPGHSRYGYMAVADTGKGMASEFVENIFDPFFSDKFPGRGLGLAVALGLVKGQGGCITVKSAPGQGSTFTVFLPLSEEPLERGEKKPDRLKANIRQDTVLVAEDQPLVRNTAISMLKRFGFDVLVARDGVEAVDIFRKRAADVSVVFSDLTMPGMNGWQTLAAIRGIRPDIPVILTSGYDESQVMADAHDHEPQAFLRKPYQMKALKETLEQVLGDS